MPSFLSSFTILFLCFVLVFSTMSWIVISLSQYFQNKTATAKVTIDKDGKITSVFLDTTYTKDGVATTKKTLKEEYGMLSPYGSSVGEWYEQVEKLEQAVVEHQGIDFLKLDDEGKTDAVSGCTIKIDAMYEALSKALDSAKK